MTTSKLPFKLTSDAVSIWLHALSEKNNANAAVELNRVAKLLRKYNADNRAALSTLIQLTPTIFHICTAIEATHNNKASLKIIRLCIQLLRNTGLAFCTITDTDNLSDDQQTLTTYMALQVIGYTQRLSTLFHEPASLTLWAESGKVYNLAIKTNCTQQKINHKIKRFNEQTTIESVIKRNILFNISSPSCYSAQQIKQLFLIANQTAEKLDINPAYSESIDTFHWDLIGEIAPSAMINEEQKKKFTISINTRNLITFMQSKAFTSELQKEELNKLFDHLSGYQTLINNPIPSAPTISRLIVGFNKISEHLINVNKLKKIQQLSNQTSSIQPTENMAIEPLPFEKNHLNFNSANTPSRNNLSLLSKTKAVKTLQVKNNFYIIAETNDFTCKLGDLALFCSTNLTHKLGIIRQIRTTNTTGTVHILIENVLGIPEIHSTTSPQSTDSHIISIHPDNGQPEVFMQRGKLNTGTQLDCISGQSFTLGNLIDYSTYFSRYHTTEQPI